MIIRTEAIVLRSLNYGETSQIVTLFTRERGKITVMAKGARVPKSRFSSTLQTMSYTQVVFYYKATRELQTLSESAHVRPFHGIGRDLKKITIGLRMMELVNALTQREEPNPMLFNLLLQVLECLDAADEHVENVLLYFQMRLAAILGFAPSIDRTTVQQLSSDTGLLALDTGAVLPPQAAAQAARRASRTALRAYAIVARADLGVVMRMELTPTVRAEVAHLVDTYLHYHVEDAYPSRSTRVIGQLLHALPDEASSAPAAANSTSDGCE